MKFSISSTALFSRLQAVSRVIVNKNSYPILECILFQLQDNNLILTASDSETTVKTQIAVIDSDSNGEFALNAKTILESMKEIPEQPLLFDINTENLNIIIKYQNGQYNTIGQPADAYPETIGLGENTVSLTMPSKAVLSGISKTIFATGNDEIRPVMNGVYFDVTPDDVTMVASDGHKLVRYKSTSSKGNEKASFILPNKPANILKALLAKDENEVIIKFDERNAVFTLADSTTMTCRFIDGRYPNYNSVIPTDNPYHVTIDRAQFLGALRRVLIFSSQSSALVKLKLTANMVVVSGQDIDFSTSAEEAIPCNFDGQDMSIGFKGTFLCDILNYMTGDNVIIELADPSRAGLVIPAEQEEGEDVLMLLMPMMLNE